MAIRRTGPHDVNIDKDNYTALLRPFADEESATRAIQLFLGTNSAVTREAMYTIEIINNLIQSNNGKSDLFQRIPPEVFGGVSEGGRKNVAASLICRASHGTGAAQQEGLPGREAAQAERERRQRLIEDYARKDGCWSDDPAGDQEALGRRHNKNIDGAESKVFFDDRGQVFKVMNFKNAVDYERFLDRISSHNATYPEALIHVEGFGRGDDGDIVTVVRQPQIQGRKPTQAEIDEGMVQRGFNKIGDDIFSFYVSQLENVAISDLNDENCVITQEGNLIVFDCNAMLKTMRLREAPEIFTFRDLLPNAYDDKAWIAILGPKFRDITEQEKSEIVKELRLTGKVNGLINGKHIELKNPTATKRVVGGKEITVFEGPVLVGNPSLFNEKTWKVPELRYNEDSVRSILSTIHALAPRIIPMDEFFSRPELAGQAANYKGGASLRNDYKDQLQKTGRIEGLVNYKYLVAADPQHPGNLLVSEPSAIKFMLWTHSGNIEGFKGRLTSEQKSALAEGKTVLHEGKAIIYDIAKGRIDNAPPSQLRRNKTQSQAQEAERKNSIRI